MRERVEIRRVREMLEANRKLVTTEEYLASLATLTAIKMAQKEVRNERKNTVVGRKP
jgi:hypothetical protein